jgi:hypothetical protein
MIGHADKDIVPSRGIGNCAVDQVKQAGFQRLLLRTNARSTQM